MVRVREYPRGLCSLKHILGGAGFGSSSSNAEKTSTARLMKGSRSEEGFHFKGMLMGILLHLIMTATNAHHFDTIFTV